MTLRWPFFIFLLFNDVIDKYFMSIMRYSRPSSSTSPFIGEFVSHPSFLQKLFLHYSVDGGGLWPFNETPFSHVLIKFYDTLCTLYIKGCMWVFLNWGLNHFFRIYLRLSLLYAKICLKLLHFSMWILMNFLINCNLC